MSHGHFIWTDLSTYDLATAKADYSAIFGWQFAGDDTYEFAHSGDLAVAGIFTMPERLAAINMPSFWMSYVHVADLENTVAKARTHDDVIIEVEPTDFDTNSRIALVRDPSGAGFTLYEGPEIAPAGQPIKRYHHLPEISLITRFYDDLFGWQFDEIDTAPWPAYDIRHPGGAIIARAEEVPADIRGKFRYWMPSFTVASASSTIETVTRRGGSVLTDLSENRTLLADRQGAHFMISEA